MAVIRKILIMTFIALLLNALGCSKQVNEDKNDDSHVLNSENPLIGIWNSDQSNEHTKKTLAR